MNMSFTARNLNEELVDALLDESMSVWICAGAALSGGCSGLCAQSSPPRYVVTTEGYICPYAVPHLPE